LGKALGGQGRHKEAEAACREAIRLEPDLAEAHGGLGVALHGQGKFEEARKAFRRAAALFPDGSPLRQQSQQAIKGVERQIELDALLADVLAGKAQPASPPERLRLAALARQPYRARYATAAALYADAFAARPSLAPPNRYNAACAAAQAGTGQGKDAAKLGGSQRLALRRPALTWLRARLASWSRLFAQGEGGTSRLTRRLTHR